MPRNVFAFALSLVAITAAQPALADELYAGVSAHQLVTPLAADTGGESVDLQIGYRGDPMTGLAAIGKPAAYVVGSFNAGDGTSFAAAGLSWKIGKKHYLRPAIGLAIHDGPERHFAADGSQTQLGSRILFAPELSVGLRLSEAVDLEASWLHLSHARIFSRVQNPGLDTIGLRLVIRLP